MRGQLFLLTPLQLQFLLGMAAELKSLMIFVLCLAMKAPMFSVQEYEILKFVLVEKFRQEASLWYAPFNCFVERFGEIGLAC